MKLQQMFLSQINMFLNLNEGFNKGISSGIEINILTCTRWCKALVVSMSVKPDGPPRGIILIKWLLSVLFQEIQAARNLSFI